jgi:hypothetical protein
MHASVPVPPGGARAGGVAPRVAVKTHLWTRWATIAIREEAAARNARDLLREIGPYGKGFDPSLESDAAMLAVSAAAHSIDGLYGEVKELIPLSASLVDAWEKNRAPRHTRIFETLKSGFRLGWRGRQWQSDLEWLFDTRDFALHHGPEFHEPVAHPLGVETSREHALYTIESGTRAVDLLLGILQRVIAAPSPKLPAVQKWSTDLGPSVELLVEKRR